MAYTTTDLRQEIIDQIAYLHDYDGDGTEECTISFVDENDITRYVPIKTHEDMNEDDLDYMPFIEVEIVDTPAKTKTLGKTRYIEQYIDFNLYYVRTDDIDIKDFHITIFNKMVHQITDDSRHNRFTNAVQVEVIDDTKSIRELKGKEIVYHKVLSVKAKRWDSG